VLKTFPLGGIHPPENKLTAGKAIETAGIPASVSIPLSQHIGAPAVALVKKGDTVRTGQKIAESKGFISACIHSPVSGKVNRTDSLIDTSGYRQEMIVIDTEGDEWDESIDRSPGIKREITAAPAEIIKKCHEAGIVGMGGATFPSHVKLSVPDGKKCEVLIINGVECEPWLTSDHRLMLEKGEEILVGISIMMKALNVTSAMVGIENNKTDAIDRMGTLARSFSGISVHALKVKYPQGAEKQLIKALINREVPSGRLPVDVGAVVHNVGTAFAVYEAVQKNKPLFERVVTVTGKSLARPGNFLARTGTPVSMLIEAAGGLPGDTGKIINGGPMMGKALTGTSVPVVKGTSGIIVIPAADAERSPAGPCIRCAKCVTGCPMNLEPFLLMSLSAAGHVERAGSNKIADCMECGSCSYICPARRPLLDYIRLGKGSYIKLLRERKLKN
jgi:electron transport complex protein RnfC